MVCRHTAWQVVTYSYRRSILIDTMNTVVKRLTREHSNFTRTRVNTPSSVKTSDWYCEQRPQYPGRMTRKQPWHRVWPLSTSIGSAGPIQTRDPYGVRMSPVEVVWVWCQKAVFYRYAPELQNLLKTPVRYDDTINHPGPTWKLKLGTASLSEWVR